MLSVPRAPDAHRLLLRHLLGAFPDAALLGSRTTPWASATFVGSRHMLTLCFASPDDAARAAARLPAMEFALRRHLVADIAGSADAEAPCRLHIEALTVEEH